MAKHHIVPASYLSQWQKVGAENQLNIYVISENKIIERGPGWTGFWRDDFNVLSDGQKKSYLPEDVTALIDTKGIEAIRRIDPSNQTQLSGEDRSAVAFYVALQYIRTPRRREEADKMIRATIQHFMREDISSPDKVNYTKEEILKHKPANKHEEEMLKEVSLMSSEEIRRRIFEGIHSGDYVAGLTTTGHSKGVLKVERLAKELFEVQWMFLVAPKDSPFITSDNPCFTVAPTKIMNGLLSPRSTVFFPLRPDVCITMKPALKSKREEFMELNPSQARDINELILQHSYESIVAKNKGQLEDLTKDFDPSKHKKSRDVVISQSGPYTMFNAE